MSSTPRFLFNLGRAYHKRGSDTDLDLEERRSALRRARQSYEDAPGSQLRDRDRPPRRLA